MNKNLRIYLVDDHPIVRQGLRMIIENQTDLEVVGETGHVATALQQIADLQPDVVVMDLRLPNGDGAKATEAIKRASPHIQVLVLTQNHDLLSLREAMAAGASGYLVKVSAVDTLITAIRAAAAGSLYFDPLIKSLVTGTFQPPPSEGKAPPTAPDLSEREEAVLRLLALGYSHKEIAVELAIGVKTVETYRHRACEKLGLQNRNAIVRYASQRGWLNNLT